MVRHPALRRRCNRHVRVLAVIAFCKARVLPAQGRRPPSTAPKPNGNVRPTATSQRMGYPAACMYFDQFKHQLPDIDPEETEEWIDSLDQVVAEEGEVRGRFLPLQAPQAGPPAQHRPAAAHPDALHQHDLARAGARLPRRRGDGAAHPADHPLERGGDGAPRQQRGSRASAATSSTYASAASLYEVGFNHFFRGKDGDRAGDQIFFQGHAAPGIYARAFLEGRLTEDQLDHFRREIVPGRGALARIRIRG